MDSFQLELESAFEVVNAITNADIIVSDEIQKRRNALLMRLDYCILNDDLLEYVLTSKITSAENESDFIEVLNMIALYEIKDKDPRKQFKHFAKNL